MSRAAASERTTSGFGDAWNRFWFTPTSSVRASFLRATVGGAALLYFAVWSVDVARFLAPEGALPPSSVSTAVSADPLYYPWRFSPLDFAPNLSVVWGIHIAALAAAALCMLGVASRWTTLLTLLAAICYVHRTPILMSPAEPLLIWSLLYLCLAPCGDFFSLDALWSKGRSAAAAGIASNIAVRLIQVHLCLHYFFVGVSQLSDQAWWSGDAVWILMAQSRTRGLDLTFLRESTFLLNGLTHALVLLAFGLALLPWNRATRRIANWLVIPYALLVAALTGMWIYALMLVGLQQVFCEEKWLERWTEPKAVE